MDCTNQNTDDLERIAHLIGSIFYYGRFKVETYNERKLVELLEKTGFLYKDEDAIIANEQKYGWD